MENNNFKSFKYVVGNDFIYKDKVVVKVFFIHDYKNFLRTIDIKKKNGANDSYYIAEAKKIVKQELDSGKLLKASKRCVNAFAKGLAITTAVVVGISAVGVGGFYTYKYITETQQHNIIQNVVDEIDALNANSTLQEITKAKEDYDRLNDTQKEQVPEETKKHLDEQIALYQKDANAADKFETDAAELDGVTDSKKEIDSIVAQEEALTTRAKTLIKAETFTKVTQAVQAYKEEEKKLNEALKLVDSLNETSSENDIKVAAKAIVDVGRATKRPDFIEKAEAAQKTVREQLEKYKKDEITVKKFETLVEAALLPTSTLAQIEKARQQKELADKVVRTDLLERIKVADANFVKADEAYKKDAALVAEFTKIAGNLSDKSSDADIKKAEAAIETVKNIQHADLLVEIKKGQANIEQQRVAYDRDKKDVDDAKAFISALAAKIKTCTKAEIEEGKKNLTEATAIDSRRQGDFKEAIDAMKKSMKEIESEYTKDEKIVQEFTERVLHLSKSQTTCTDNEIKDMEKRADEIKTSVTRPDFAKEIDDGAKTIQAVRELYIVDKKKVDDFVASTKSLDGITDTKDEVDAAAELYEVAKDVKRPDLKEVYDPAFAIFKNAFDNFYNDYNDAEAVIKLITDIETEDVKVLDQTYINNISTAYGALKNDRSRGIADAESIEKWDKNVTGRVADLQQALTDASAINLQLMGLPSEAAGYTNDNLKFQLLSIAALYDNLDVPTQKAITLENRAKIALRSEIGLNNAYSFTSLNGSGIATEPEQHIYWDDNYGYYVKGTLIDNAAAQILSLDASTVSTIKSKFSSIKFCASVTSNETGDPQTLSIKSNGDAISNPSLTEALTLIEVQTADLSADGELEFIINNSNSKNFDLTFLYGVPNE